MKAMIYGAGGGTSSDEVTALKKHVLSPYTTITNDSGDEIVAGTMVDNGAVNRSLKCGESYTIVEGFHNGSGVISADSLASQTGANAAAGDILTGKTAWVNGIKLTGTLPTMAGGTKTPSTSQITVACSGYKMTSNIIIPAFSLPDKSKLASGYTYTLYGKSVTGTATIYKNPSTILKGNTIASGYSISRKGGSDSYHNSDGYNLEVNGKSSAKVRLDQVLNLSDWNYIKIKANTSFHVGLSDHPDFQEMSTPCSGINSYTIIDIRNISGNKYIKFSATNDNPTVRTYRIFEIILTTN